MLNAIDQTGPVGKLLSVPLPEEFYNALVTNNSLSFKIDESTGAADAFAVDFIRLLINRKRENTCKDYMLQHGIDAGRIIAIGFGPDRPVAPNDTEANRARNRRVEMRFMKL